MANLPSFKGFYEPQSNYSKLPHQLINALVEINSIAELKVVLYILRHTWGFRDTYKRITIDEFMHGRKRKNGTRIDNGTGLSVNSVRKGIADAIAHGFIELHIDDTDKSRWKQAYSLRTIQDEADYQNLIVDNVTRLSEFDPRSEKETLLERNLSTPATAGVGREPAKIKRSEPIPWPVPNLTEKLLAGETTKQVASPKPRERDLIFESVLLYGHNITYVSGMELGRTGGWVRGVVKELKIGGVDPQKFVKFCEGYKTWSQGLTFPRDAVKLLASYNQWKSEQPQTEEQRANSWTPLHAAYQAATNAPDSERGRILSMPTKQLESAILMEDDFGNTALAPFKPVIVALREKAGQ